MKQEKNKIQKLSIYLQPNAKKDEIVGPYQDQHLKITVKAAAVENQANKALINLLSKTHHIPKSHIKITKGLKSHYKIVEISD